MTLIFLLQIYSNVFKLQTKKILETFIILTKFILKDEPSAEDIAVPIIPEPQTTISYSSSLTFVEYQLIIALLLIFVSFLRCCVLSKTCKIKLYIYY